MFERVRALIARIARIAPGSICDECIAKNLDLPWPSQANQAAR